MDRSSLFAVLAAVMMGWPAIYAIVAPVSSQEICMRVIFGISFAIGISALIVQGIWLKKERVRNELKLAEREAEREAERDQRFDELALLIKRQQSVPLLSPGQPLSLKTRAQLLTDELFAFLHTQGPEPPSPLSVKGSEAEQRRAFNAYFDWKGQIYRHYMAYFRDRVVQIDRELAALKPPIFTKLDMREIDPPETTGEVDLRKIAETLLIKAASIPE